MRSADLAVPLAALLAAALPAQDIASGPPKGRALSELRVVDPGRADPTPFDVAQELARGPGAILFVHEITRNVAPVIRGFDEDCSDLAVLGLRSALVLLTPDRTAAEQRAPVVARAVRLQHPLLISVDGAEGPGNYALNRKAALTLVLTKDGVVVDSVPFVDTGGQDLDFVRLCLESVAGPAPEDADALRAALRRTLPAAGEELVDRIVQLELQRRRLQARVRELEAAPRGDNRPMGRDQMRAQGERPAAADRPGERGAAHPPAAVPDAALALQVRTIVRKDVSADELESAFAAIDARLRDAPELADALARTFQDVLAQDGYGSDAARQRLRAWLAKRSDGRREP